MRDGRGSNRDFLALFGQSRENMKFSPQKKQKRFGSKNSRPKVFVMPRNA